MQEESAFYLEIIWLSDKGMNKDESHLLERLHGALSIREMDNHITLDEFFDLLDQDHLLVYANFSDPAYCAMAMKAGHRFCFVSYYLDADLEKKPNYVYMFGPAGMSMLWSRFQEEMSGNGICFNTLSMSEIRLDVARPLAVSEKPSSLNPSGRA